MERYCWAGNGFLHFDDQACRVITAAWEAHQDAVQAIRGDLPETYVTALFGFFGGPVNEIRVSMDFWPEVDYRLIAYALTRALPSLVEEDREITEAILATFPRVVLH